GGRQGRGPTNHWGRALLDKVSCDSCIMHCRGSDPRCGGRLRRDWERVRGSRRWDRPMGPPAAVRRLPVYIVELIAIGGAYFALAKLGLALASLHPSASPIWPPTGFALAAVLLWGYRVAPAVFVAAFSVNALTAGSLATALAIAAGNPLEAVAGGALIDRWSGGRHTFETPARVAKFCAAAFAATTISATIGVGSLAFAGYAAWASVPPIWLTWWLGDLTGAIVIAPVLVLWAGGADARSGLRESLGVFAA